MKKKWSMPTPRPDLIMNLKSSKQMMREIKKNHWMNIVGNANQSQKEKIIIFEESCAYE